MLLWQKLPVKFSNKELREMNQIYMLLDRTIQLSKSRKEVRAKQNRAEDLRF